MNSNPTLLKFYIPFLATLSYIIGDIFFWEKIFEANRDFTVEWQNPPNSFLNFLAKLFSFIGSPEGVGGITFLLFYFSHNKLYITFLFIWMGFTGYIISFLKNVYSVERPYMKYSDIVPGECDFAYGRPSGHSYGGVFFFTVVIEYFLRKPRPYAGSNSQMSLEYESSGTEDNIDEIIGNKWEDKTKAQIIKQILLLALGPTIALCIMFSRVYLGVHSLDQIFLGGTYALLNLTLFFNFRGYFYIKLKNIHEETVGSRGRPVKVLLGTIVAFALFLIIPTIIYAVKNNNEYPTVWIENIKKYCTIKPEKLLLGKCYLETAVVSGVFGAFLSFFICKGNFKPCLFEANFRKLTLKMHVIRLGLLIINAAIFAVALKYIPFGEDLVVVYFFRENLRFFLFGIVFIWGMPFLYLRLGVAIPGDLFSLYKVESGQNDVELLPPKIDGNL